MSNGFTFIALAGLLGAASACIIVTDDDDDTEGGTGNDSSNPTGSNPTGSDPTGSDPTSGNGTTAAETTAQADSGSGDATTAADETGGGRSCGWGPTGDPTIPEGYICGGEGEDPAGDFPLLCPADIELVVGGACGDIQGQGCCDAVGNAWFCGDDGNGPALARLEC